MDIDEICTIWSMYVHTLRNKQIFFLKNKNLKKMIKHLIIVDLAHLVRRMRTEYMRTVHGYSNAFSRKLSS